MRIVLAHNSYLQRGGEDIVVEAEASLLRSEGHEVTEFRVDNSAVDASSRVRTAAAAIWSFDSKARLEQILADVRPDLCHFHNTFPLISPSAYHACQAAGVPVVQTLHNYRLVCPAATLFRDGHPCVECLERSVPWPGVVHACYRSSRAATAAVAAMLVTHRALGTWQRDVDAYITPSDFARSMFLSAGFKPDHVFAKPNFLPFDPGVGDHRGGYALFVGRLTEDKGIPTLLDAWREIGGRLPLKVVGTGPLAGHPNGEQQGVEWLGERGREEIFALMRDATLLIFPSIWFETFGLTIIEAFATALPVVASRLGTALELIENGVTGLHFTAGDAHDLALTVQRALDDADRLAALGRRGRVEFERKFTAAATYELQMQIYQRAIERRTKTS
jgi:glycosyltransferase involved in cell wall biosynthesis